MPEKTKTVLGINPGAKYLGIAVFRGLDLREWMIKSIKGKWSQKKMKRTLKIVSGLIESYRPDALSLKRLHPSRSSPELRKLSSKIQAIAQRKELIVFQFSIKELEGIHLEDERSNKRKLAEKMAADYPCLYGELNSERANRNPYYLRMFEAVALGLVGAHKLDK